MNYFKKTMTFLLVMVMATGMLTFAFAGGEQEGGGAPEQRFISFGSASPGGNWFVMGGSFANLLNEKLRKSKGLNFAAESTGGTNENLRRMRVGEMEIGMSHAGPMYEAYNGIGTWEEKHDNLRAFAKLYASPFVFVTPQSTGIKTIEDIKGKKVAVGPAGSGSYANAEIILTALGLWDEIQINTLAFSDAGRALGDGDVDVIAQAGAPHPYLLALEANHPVHLITVTMEQLEAVSQQHPYYYIDTLPGKTYETYEKPYECIYFSVYLVMDAGLDEDAAYEIAKVTFSDEEKKVLSESHHYWKTLAPALNEWSGMGIPLHPGVERYYREAGISIPDNISNQ